MIELQLLLIFILVELGLFGGGIFSNKTNFLIASTLLNRNTISK